MKTSKKGVIVTYFFSKVVQPVYRIIQLTSYYSEYVVK